MEISVIRKPLMEQKSYVIVKNHVRELSNTTQISSNTNYNEEKALKSTKNPEAMKRKRTSSKKQSKNVEENKSSSESVNICENATEIDPSDIKELKIVYMRCKEVMKRIEMKYGHLLNLESEMETSVNHLKRKYYSETIEDECKCKTKKKIVFDEDGQQSTVDVSDKHICVNKIITPNPGFVPKQNISVEYQDAELGLPENIHELREMLRDPNLENTTRYRIFDKIRLLKQEYTNEIKFNKHILIDKLRSNPDEILDFKGSNLSTIPGYS